MAGLANRPPLSPPYYAAALCFHTPILPFCMPCWTLRHPAWLWHICPNCCLVCKDLLPHSWNVPSFQFPGSIPGLPHCLLSSEHKFRNTAPLIPTWVFFQSQLIKAMERCKRKTFMHVHVFWGNVFDKWNAYISILSIHCPHYPFTFILIQPPIWIIDSLSVAKSGSINTPNRQLPIGI